MLIWIVFVLLLAFLFRHPNFFKDVQHVLTKLKIKRCIQKYVRTNFTILDHFLEVVEAQPNKPYILFKDETYTYRDVDELSNKAARVFLQNGLVKQGDTVAFFLGNEPAFMWLWLGLQKLGCPVAFLNYNIRSRALLHCLSCSGATSLVGAEEFQDAVEEVLPSLLEQQISVFILADRCQNECMMSFKDKLKQASSQPISKDLRSHVTLQSPALYIYTSGTTGLPKAAELNHLKLWALSKNLSSAGMNSNDVIYTSLPLYHAVGFFGLICTIEMGATAALKTKFSASQFWDDCRKYNVTVIQYIGEIVRYICNTPRKLNDQNHKVRMAVGNGLRADVWRDFISRFGNIRICEFYGATEGNFGLQNYCEKIGAVGRHSFLLKKFFPYTVVKYDVDKEAPVRDSSGFCIKVATGEPGLFLSEITMKSPFYGYARDLQQTEKKKLHNVHKKGDVYFNTGDLLSISEDSFIYFHDRVGDTFRWKGENVSSTEVADVVTMADCIEECNAYGVQVPGQEGRVGMAAVSLREGQKFDSTGVFENVEKFLPTYARPRFIRIKSSLEVTGTYKYMKSQLVKEGFNPNEIKDSLYLLEDKDKRYVPLTLDIFNSVISGKIKI
ncbi:long-chain fatty acid transport protein 2-like isoform X1 [Antennarius striatus]|uniref:long-chain fatty acid transport protein 2-like isoform X1 n=1 Tax=Antennarius striatus TaxID=241820 RepID=UPI0035B3DDFA